MAAITATAALYVDENITFGVGRDRTAPEAHDGELLIEAHFSGANPADIKHATQLGIYPAILGYDFCGKVLKAASTSTFHHGDIVAGYTPTGIGRPAKYGTHQRYLVCPDDMAFLVPPNLPLQHAACLSVVTMTAADALYNIFKFPLPDESSIQRTVGPLLVWGASSSVGLCAVQFARASGIHPIFVTASPERHALLLQLGATNCFDYKSPNVKLEINAALQDFRCGALLSCFDTVGSHKGKGSAALMARCASQDAVLVSVVVQPDSRFKMPFATPNKDVGIKVHGVPLPVTIPARPVDYKRARRAFHWAIDNYGVGLHLPIVEVFNGTAEDALDELKLLADHGRGFGKLALQHPLL